MSRHSIPPPPAYSYVRFSHPDQARGDSLRRQMEAASAWAERNHVHLDESLTLQDLGKSAYTGSHRQNPDRHALAAFLKLVEQGKVPRGSFLVVENLDRLSREHIQPALLLVLNLLQAGVRVVQLKPSEMVFDDKSDTLPVMMMMMELSRGHGESAIKSERIGAAWREKKRRVRVGENQKETTYMGKNRKILTRRIPAWVEEHAGRLRLIPERAATIKEIFVLAQKGYGNRQIVRRLTRDKVPAFGPSGRWTRSYVHDILRDRRVCGIYTPRYRKGRKADGEPIRDYFPRVVSDDLWDVLNRERLARSQQGCRVGKYIHMFSGLIKNARDGQGYQAGSQHRRGRLPYRVLINSTAEGQTRLWTFPLDHFEQAVLSLLKELNAHDILNGDEGPDESLELAARLARVEASIASITREMDDNGESPALFKRLREKEAEQNELATRLADARVKAMHPLSASWGEVQTLADVLNSAPEEERDDIRLRLRAAIRQITESVWLLVVPRGRLRLCAAQFWFNAKAGPKHRSFLILSRPAIGNASARKPGGWSALSFASAGLPGADIDLRRPADVRKVEKLLATMELPNLKSV